MTSTAGLHGWLERWDRYWFDEIPPHSAAILRILLGLAGLAALFGLTPASTYWPIDSLAPSFGGGIGLRSSLAASGLGGVAGYTLLAALTTTYAAMVLGVGSAIAVPVAFVLTAAQGFWNPLPLSSSHKIFVALLFCLMWADAGGALALDRSWRVTRHIPVIGSRCIWPLRLIRVQLALVYLSSGLWKLMGESWRDGMAVHYALSQNAFHRFPGPIPSSLDGVLTVATYVTLAWELGFVFMLLHPTTRRLALWTGVGLHVGLAATLELGTFSGVMLAGYIAFLDPGYVERIASRVLHFRLRHRDERSVIQPTPASTARS